MSRQGEGKLTGVESYFIRTSGCNLRCWFCDTPYASWDPEGGHEAIDDVVRAAVNSGRQNVVLTGGEPLLPSTSSLLCEQLSEANLHLTIETAGTIDQPVACDLMSISPKLASSAPEAAVHSRWHQLHQQRRRPLGVMRSLIARSAEFQLKFVVGSPADYDEVCEIAQQLDAHGDDVWVMPEGTTLQQLDQAAGWLKPWCERQSFRYCDRMQIRWYGNRRGT